MSIYEHYNDYLLREGRGSHKCDGCIYKGEHEEMGFKPFGVCFKEKNLIEAEKAYNAEICPYKKTPFILGVDLAEPKTPRDDNIDAFAYSVARGAEDLQRFLIASGAGIKTPYDDKITEAAQFLSKEEKPAYLPQLYKIEGVDLAEPVEWPKENPLFSLVKPFAMVAEAAKQIGRALMALSKATSETIQAIKIDISSYPNKRVKHLARHAKKARVRKKNINRIIKHITAA